MCTDFFAHDNAGALSGLVEVRAADTLAEVIVFEHAGVDFLTKRNVSTEATGCKHDPFIGHELCYFTGVIVFSDDTDNTPFFVLDQRLNLHVCVCSHVILVGV